MTVKSYKKVFKQLKNKPAKLKKYIKHNAPKKREFGRSTNRCKVCGSTKGMISQYEIGYCRRCFRLNAKKLGFKKFH
ncbi:MAG: 30S ribosomal protein S14 [Candidatus Nanoarchaeia archaeon]|nr:30S ribosomal protein S14 [Candidatus Nanoarchaeia archaeon]